MPDRILRRAPAMTFRETLGIGLLSAILALAFTVWTDRPVSSQAQAVALEPVRLSSQLKDAWALYRQRHIDKTGRVVDGGSNGISHSEGQGYAMVLAVYAGDRASFDAIWSWTQANLGVRRDGLFAWKWDPAATPNVPDPNNATDGDVLIAWGLALAGATWNEPVFTASARRLMTSIEKLLASQGSYGLMMPPGAVGFGASDRPDGPVVNPSYWVFPALEAFTVLDPDGPWANLLKSGRKLVEVARQGPLGLPPDWVSVAGPTPRAATGYEPVFGYNAVRIPLYLAMASNAKELIRPYSGLWSPAGDLGPYVIDIRTGSAGREFGGRGFKTVMALARCIETGDPIPASLRRPDPKDAYYPATLALLALIALHERHPSC
jgi:endo-1,4-beta-D-glucanase Y